jgi:hypothetical protein
MPGSVARPRRVRGYAVTERRAPGRIELDIRTPRLTHALELGAARLLGGPRHTLIGGVPVHLGQARGDGLPDLAVDTARWLKRLDNRVLVVAVDLRSDEWAVLAPGLSLAVLDAAHPTPPSDRLDRLLDLCNAMVDPSTAWAAWQQSLSRRRPRGEVPAALSEAARRLRSWIIGDDLERAERIAGASSSALERLVELVAPHTSHIDALLDSFGEAPPAWATRLGAMAEAAAEARIELRRRRSRLRSV